MNVLQSWYYFGHLEIISDIFLTLGLFMSWTSRVLLGFALILFSGCDNEVDINADWKETIVVYGLLNPNDSIQYIKVNKAFLNENFTIFKKYMIF